MISAADAGIASLALGLMSVVKPAKVLHKAVLKLFRPDIHLFFNLKSERARLGDLERKIEQLWGRGWRLSDRAILNLFGCGE
jgi:hypothetical protein